MNLARIRWAAVEVSDEPLRRLSEKRYPTELLKVKVLQGELTLGRLSPSWNRANMAAQKTTTAARVFNRMVSFHKAAVWSRAM